MSAWCCRCVALKRARKSYKKKFGIDGVEEDQLVCRICYEGGEGLIVPCLCTGSSKCVHRRCLDNWRATRHNEQCFTHCTTCNYKYRLCMNQPRVSKRVKLCLLLIRDILTFFIIAELLIVLMSVICYGLDIPAGKNIWRIFPHQSWPDAAQVGVYYLAGIVFFFACLGLIGLLVGSFCFCCKTPGCCNDSDAAFIGLYCCWFGYPCHLGYYYPATPVYRSGCAGCVGCNANKIDYDTKKQISLVICILLPIILVFLVITGIIFSTVILVWFILVLCRRHFSILYKRERAKEEVVCNLFMYEYAAIENLPAFLDYEGAPQEV